MGFEPSEGDGVGGGRVEGGGGGALLWQRALRDVLVFLQVHGHVLGTCADTARRGASLRYCLQVIRVGEHVQNTSEGIIEIMHQHTLDILLRSHQC